MKFARDISLALSLGLAGTLPLVLVNPPSAAAESSEEAAACAECHAKNPAHVGLVEQWLSSAHAEADVGCAACHGEDHRDASDVHRATTPVSVTCGSCHAENLVRYRDGKHGAAWIAMQTFPAGHGLADASTTAERGCDDCHSIGTRPMTSLSQASGVRDAAGSASCDACHTRHEFSPDAARDPRACARCHQGTDHPQWEMYSASAHGRASPATDGKERPTCQNCHMEDGDHGVGSAWGFYGVRWPTDAVAAVDPQWGSDQRTILRALGMIDAEARPTWRFTAARVLDMFRTSEEEFESERGRMVSVCMRCHEEADVRDEFRQDEDHLRQADRLMASAIEIVGQLMSDGILESKGSVTGDHPDLLAVAPNAGGIETRLWAMYSEHRSRAFMGAFHDSPLHARDEGLEAMRVDLVAIRAMGAELRTSAGR